MGLKTIQQGSNKRTRATQCNHWIKCVGFGGLKRSCLRNLGERHQDSGRLYVLLQLWNHHWRMVKHRASIKRIKNSIKGQVQKLSLKVIVVKNGKKEWTITSMKIFKFINISGILSSLFELNLSIVKFYVNRIIKWTNIFVIDFLHIA